MKVIIDLPDEAYEGLINRNKWFGMDVQFCGESFAAYIKTGFAIPKECERLRLINESSIQNFMVDFDFSTLRWIDEVSLSNATIKMI